MSERRDSIHPDAEQLDRLRAGLLDDQPEAKGALEAHLAECGHCQAQYGLWDRLVGLLDEASPANDAPAPAASSDSDRHRGRRGFVWAGALATTLAATLAGLGLAVGVFLNQGPPETASVAEAPPDPEMVGEPPDLYADIDFYLWMMEHQGESQSNDPNSS